MFWMKQLDLGQFWLHLIAVLLECLDGFCSKTQDMKLEKARKEKDIKYKIQAEILGSTNTAGWKMDHEWVDVFSYFWFCYFGRG